MDSENPGSKLPPKVKWGFSDEELASHPIAFRNDFLKDCVYIVTGGGTGFGRAITYTMIRLGAKVVICGRRAENLKETADGAQRLLGTEVVTHQMTIREPDQVEGLIDKVWEQFGRLDGVVNNAGGQFPQSAIDFSVKGWNAVIDTNLNGTWYMMQSAARHWKDRNCPGAIVNIVAVVGRGMPQVAHTCAARAAVVDLSKALATEWAPLGIRINCVAPGSIESEGFNVYPPGVAELFTSSNPMRQLGDVFDVAHAVVFLMGPAGRPVNGAVLTVDGGRQNWGEDWPAGMPDYFRVPGR